MLEHNLGIKLFADGADKAEMIRLAKSAHINGLTTNPTLMRKAGISDYKAFSLEVLQEVRDKPISFEVFSDDFDQMERQALEIASWADNVYVKIPITNSHGDSSLHVVQRLSARGIKVNVTALLTITQVRESVESLSDSTPAYISVFAGRIADTGIDPIPTMAAAVELVRIKPKAELIWASPREVLNIVQAANIGCHILTATPEILNKLKIIGKNLNEYSLDTVKMFSRDARESKFSI